jgi:hypothetical protein
MKVSARSTLAVLLFSLIGGLGLAASPGDPGAARSAGQSELKAVVDYAAFELRVSSRLSLQAEGLRLPEDRVAAEKLLDRRSHDAMATILLGLWVDHAQKLGDLVASGELGLDALRGAAEGAARSKLSLSPDTLSIQADYSLSLASLLPLLFAPDPALRPRAPLGWSASAAYSGILIYAQDSLPIHGEKANEFCVPLLLPRLFDSDMALLFDPRMLSADAASRAPVQYASNAQDERVRARVGERPLRIVASEGFGIRRGDLVVPKADAQAILALRQNRQLLEEGKIAILVRRPSY